MIMDKVQTKPHMSSDCCPLSISSSGTSFKTWKSMQKKKKKNHTDFGGNGVAFLIIGLNQGIAEARSVFFPGVRERFLPLTTLSKQFCAAVGAVILSCRRVASTNPCRTAQGVCWQSRGFTSVC